MLGARKKWQLGGVPEATEAFNHFARLVIASVRAESAEAVIGGGIETDSAMIVFSSALPALHAARRMFMWAFKNQRNPNAPRLWLRGSLVSHNDEEFTRRESKMNDTFGNVSIFTYSEAALDAISVEKAGFKGMRLMVRSDVICNETQQGLRIPFGKYSLIPIRRLRHSLYPKAAEGDFVDFLWMACRDDKEFNDISLHMTYRLRHASKDADEFAQAAATQVVFHECAALRQSVVSRAKRSLINNGQQIACAEQQESSC